MGFKRHFRAKRKWGESDWGEVEVGIRATADEVKLSPIAEKSKSSFAEKKAEVLVCSYQKS